MKKIIKIQAVKFAIGGFIGFLINCLTLYILTEYILGKFSIYSVIIGHTLNQVFNFFFQKYIVFKNKETKNTFFQFMQYTCWVLIMLGMGAYIADFLVLRIGLHYMISQVVMITLLAVLNFYITKKIFRNNPL